MSQPDDLEERIQAGDEAAFTVPVLGHAVTTNEIHAIQLGIGAGLALGKSGHPLPAAALAAYATIAPYRPGRRIGSKTITHEPWWFCSGLIAGYAIGR